MFYWTQLWESNPLSQGYEPYMIFRFTQLQYKVAPLNLSRTKSFAISIRDKVLQVAILELRIRVTIANKGCPCRGLTLIFFVIFKRGIRLSGRCSSVCNKKSYSLSYYIYIINYFSAFVKEFLAYFKTFSPLCLIQGSCNEAVNELCGPIWV